MDKFLETYSTTTDSERNRGVKRLPWKVSEWRWDRWGRGQVKAFHTMLWLGQHIPVQQEPPL